MKTTFALLLVGIAALLLVAGCATSPPKNTGQVPAGSTPSGSAPDMTGAASGIENDLNGPLSTLDTAPADQDISINESDLDLGIN